MRIGTNTNVVFRTYEASDGSSSSQGIEVVLEKEEDNQWLVIQERVLPDDEIDFDQLLLKS